MYPVTEQQPSPDAALHGGGEPSAPPARVYGRDFTDLPQDLYIPPDALEVFLDAFEGPLDLLLYLIRKQNIDILDIPVADITRQYMGYVELMKSVCLELAAEYLVMAAMLAEIKSRMLLPRSSEASAEEDDPRAELIRRLQEYERFKQAAEELDALPRVGRELHVPQLPAPEARARTLLPQVCLEEVLLAMAEVMRRAELLDHQVAARGQHVSKAIAIGRVAVAVGGGGQLHAVAAEAHITATAEGTGVGIGHVEGGTGHVQGSADVVGGEQAEHITTGGHAVLPGLSPDSPGYRRPVAPFRRSLRLRSHNAKAARDSRTGRRHRQGARAVHLPRPGRAGHEPVRRPARCRRSPGQGRHRPG